VLCALAVSTAVGLWIKLPIVRPLIAVFVPLSLLTFFVFGWLERGPRASRSFRSIASSFGHSFFPRFFTLFWSLLARSSARCSNTEMWRSPHKKLYYRPVLVFRMTGLSWLGTRYLALAVAVATNHPATTDVVMRGC